MVDLTNFLNQFQAQIYVVLGILGIVIVVIGIVNEDLKHTLGLVALVVLIAIFVAICGNLQTIGEKLSGLIFNGLTIAPRIPVDFISRS